MQQRAVAARHSSCAAAADSSAPSKALRASAGGRLPPDDGDYTRNPLAVGHLINHSRARANVAARDVRYAADCAYRIPVVTFGGGPVAPAGVPGIALYASRAIAQGEELFLDYAFTSAPANWPAWYRDSD